LKGTAQLITKKRDSMKKTFVSVWLVTVIFSLLPTMLAAHNIVLNPGFESAATEPKNWTITGPVTSMQPRTTIDGKTKFDGLYGLKMASDNPNCHGRAVQVVPVKSGQTYQFSARFLAKDVNSLNKSVMIKITWLKDGENLGYNYIYDLTGESKGWMLAANTIQAVEGASSAEISLEFRWSNGTIWWDNIVMEPCAPLADRLVKVATIYCRPPGPSVEQNLALMSGLIDQAGKENCQFICLPEGWMTNNTGLAMTKVPANSLDGPATAMLADKAKQYGMYIISGQYNWIGDTLNNVAVLYNPSGKIQAIYKKVHLPDSEAEQGAVPGNSMPVFDTKYGKIGMLICWDYAFPEVSRAMALQGAEILFCPIAGDIRGKDGDINRIIARSRAVDNGVFFVTAIYDGSSMIIDPAGNVLQESKEQGRLLTATINLNYNPPWDWIGNAGRGDWKGVWRKDRRSDVFAPLGHYTSTGSSGKN
jgi:predicted amidohydrolase